MKKRKEKERGDVREDVMVSIRMQPELRERIIRHAEKAALPFTLYARMLLKRALDKIEAEKD